MLNTDVESLSRNIFDPSSQQIEGQVSKRALSSKGLFASESEAASKRSIKTPVEDVFSAERLLRQQNSEMGQTEALITQRERLSQYTSESPSAIPSMLRQSEEKIQKLLSNASTETSERKANVDSFGSTEPQVSVVAPTKQNNVTVIHEQMDAVAIRTQIQKEITSSFESMIKEQIDHMRKNLQIEYNEKWERFINS
jgi:hypothetical protein